MSNLLWKSLVVSPAFLGATLLVSATALAAPNAATQANVTQANATQSLVIPQKPEILAETTARNEKVLDQVKTYSNDGSALSPK